MINSCSHCPIDSSERVCPAIVFNHRRYCELIDREHRDFDPRYSAILEREAEPIERVSGSAPETRADSHAGSQPTADVIRERLSLVHACDYRGPKTGCGCDDRRVCGLGLGSNARDERTATIVDCLRCVSGGLG